MSTTDKDIYDAFAAIVEAYGIANSIPVSWPGIQFTPPTAGEWLEVSWFPNETVNYGIGDVGPSQHRGFGQVSCCARPGAGIDAIMSRAGSIIALLAKGTLLGAARVERKPWASSVLIADDRVKVPITVRYEGMVRN